MFNWVYQVAEYFGPISGSGNEDKKNKVKINFSKSPDEIIVQKLLNAEQYFDVENPYTIQKYHDVEILKEIFENLVAEEKQNQGTNEIDWKPKLVFTQIQVNSLAEWFAPGSSIPLGFIHALVKTLHWVDSSLVEPDFNFYCANKAVLVVDLEMILKKEDEVIQSIAEIVSKWNSKKEYSKTKSNCQHFAKDVIENGLGLKFEGNQYSDAVKIIIDNLTKSGSYELQNLFKNKQYSHLQHLKTHRDVDLYVIRMEAERKLSKQDKLLLKAFDRAFWLNSITVKEKLQKYKREKEEHNYFIGKIDQYKQKELLKRTQAALTSEFYNHPKFTSSHESQMKNIRDSFEKMNKKEQLNDDEIAVLKENLLTIWKVYVKYASNKIPELEEELDESKDIYGHEVVKSLVADLVEQNAVSQSIYNELYPEDGKYPLEFKEFEKHPEIAKFIAERYFLNYKRSVCPFDCPMDTVSFGKVYK